MDDIRRANFPMKMLDENIFAPRKTIPSPDESSSEPVFAIQVSFVTGALWIMTGQGEIIRLLSKACHNELFTREELLIGNLCRRDLIPPLNNVSKESPELANQLVRPNYLGSDARLLSTPEFTWAYFNFTSSSLVTLKSRAAETISHISNYISTDDALSALIWQSIVRARLPRLASTTKSTLARAVDVRRYLNIPVTYPGMMQNMTYHTYTLQQLMVEPLGVVASQLRSAVDRKTSDLEYRTRVLAAFLNSEPDKSVVSFTAAINTSKDIMISSWSKVQGYELDFNFGLGEPEAVRRPRLIPVEGLIYFMPRTQDGEIAVALCLSNGDMERLRVDEEFGKYGYYIG
ncbi:hypothetical protein C0995_006745 [Termitomyces sp. Mi166|nr:hypothetical protein C0995_006745 [Termitomyces sp. Mi166\